MAGLSRISIRKLTRNLLGTVLVFYLVVSVFSNEPQSHKSLKSVKRQSIAFNPKKRYIQRPWSEDSQCRNFTIRRAAKKALPQVALASYPGSGNTWVRYLIEAGSGISTGSIYKDANLYFLGFWGELCDWDSGETIVQKTHDCGRHHVRSFSNGSGILLMRNPYDAILSFHNFLYGGHTGYAPSKNFQKKEWPEFVSYQARHWLSMTHNWTTFADRLLVLHYESLIEDPIPQVRRVLDFLDLPVDEERLNCLQKYPRGRFKRNGKSALDEVDRETIFPLEVREKLDQVVRYADHIIRKTGNPGVPFELYRFYDNEKWLRKTVSRKEEKLKQDEKSLLQKYIEWSPRLVSMLTLDPLEAQVKESRSSLSRMWDIKFDKSFPEVSFLEKAFNGKSRKRRRKSVRT